MCCWRVCIWEVDSDVQYLLRDVGMIFANLCLINATDRHVSRQSERHTNVGDESLGRLRVAVKIDSLMSIPRERY